MERVSYKRSLTYRTFLSVYCLGGRKWQETGRRAPRRVETIELSASAQRAISEGMGGKRRYATGYIFRYDPFRGSVMRSSEQVPPPRDGGIYFISSCAALISSGAQATVYSFVRILTGEIDRN